MKELEMLTAALKSGESVVRVIRENAEFHDIYVAEAECPCGTPSWEEYVAAISADAVDAPLRAA